MSFKEMSTRWLGAGVPNKVAIFSFLLATLLNLISSFTLFSLELAGVGVASLIATLISLLIGFGLLSLSKVARIFAYLYGIYSGLYLISLVVLAKAVPFLEDLISLVFDVIDGFALICYMGPIILYFIAFICLLVGKKSYNA